MVIGDANVFLRPLRIIAGGTVVADTVEPSAPHQDDGEKAKVSYPWTTFAGEVDLRMLSRIRQGLVAYVRSNPGCQAADVR